MTWIVQNLWLIPALPMLAAGMSALAPQRCRRFSATLAIGSMVIAFLLSLCAFAHTLQHGGPEAAKEVFNFEWLRFAAGDRGILKLGWVLDPLAAVMLVMVTFVGTSIFIYSVGYMAHDENFTRFFTFLSLFAGAMLGVIIANSLVLLFMCWELVGLTSYLLIGFWYHKPSAAAAAKKAFITTRIGDVAFLLGMVWLYAQTGTLLFYDNGAGCLEQASLANMVMRTAGLGLTVSTAIGLLIFAGAAGKSGQVPLHVWLPDAMEGPTPVSALIHAATMVAAGVFLVARVYPLMAVTTADIQTPKPFAFAIAYHELTPDNQDLQKARTTAVAPAAARETNANRGEPVVHSSPAPVSIALRVITWIGAITALFAASIAVAQNDIKRILAYSTVSQLGYMMMGLGTGGVAVGMFHLITHAFFKALLFLGAGSVIHGCHDEQDIRRMGGVKKYMPVTFLTYAIGMLALAGFPLLFSGFWSKDEILHAAHGWPVSHLPFYLGLAGAFLTAFYMTRQVVLVFFGQRRTGVAPVSKRKTAQAEHENREVVHSAGDDAAKMTHDNLRQAGSLSYEPHESPRVMTVPLMILAFFAIALGFFGTPAWPWFQTFLGQPHGATGFTSDVISLMLLSTVIVLAGLASGWWLYGRKPIQNADQPDPLERLPLGAYVWFAKKYGIDELYEITIIRFNAWFARACAFLDEWVWGILVALVSYGAVGLGWISDTFDKFVINLGFDQSCDGVTRGSKLLSSLQNGRVQNYLRVIGFALAALVLFLIWGGNR